jgi:futalosine hydrolase
MRILIVAATAAEIAPLVAQLSYEADGGQNVARYAYRGHAVDVLTTGVGMVATAAWTSKALAEARYDFGLNLGVCGSFVRTLAPETVVHVISDCIAELGAEDDEAFLTIEELNIVGANNTPLDSSRIVNPSPPRISPLNALLAVRGVTVNTVHGNDASIAAFVQRFNPDVESMEGAAFMYACAIHGLVFAQVRAVSNIIEKRNRAAWSLAPAIRNLGETALRILDNL